MDDVILELNGREYCWEYFPDVCVAAESWSWSDTQTFIVAPNSIVRELNHGVLSNAMLMLRVVSEVAPATQADFQRTVAILQSMGATSADLKRIGLEPYSTSHTDISSIGVPQTGILRQKGYKVGINGLDRHERRSILEEVLIEELEKIESDDYMRGWGEPKTAERLLKIANVLASLCRNAKHNPSPPVEAIEQWEADLAWLKANFAGTVNLHYWPSSDI